MLIATSNMNKSIYAWDNENVLLVCDTEATGAEQRGGGAAEGRRHPQVHGGLQPEGRGTLQG